MNAVLDQLVHLEYALNTLYILFSAALVLWMAAGFSMLEAGLVRSKNVVDILTKNIGLYSIACLCYLLMGYNVMYGDSASSLLPSFGHWFLGADASVKDVLASPDEVGYSSMADFFFQVVFVATAMSVVSGAVAERMKLWSFFLFVIVMTAFIYPVQGYWHWGGGFLNKLGFVDFAGSGVVHLAGGAAALAGVLLLGPRIGKYVGGHIKAIPGSNLSLTALGTMILWLGWLGFNGGSQLAIGDIENANIVSLIFVNTNIAAAAGFLAALLFSKLAFKKSDLTLGLNGALAGLVAITASPATPSVDIAILIGGLGGVIATLSILFLDRLKIDDPVGAISVHGSAGIFGLLVVPLSDPAASVFHQLIGVVVIFAWVFVCSFVVWFVIKKFVGLRVSEQEELEGNDIHECGLEAYPDLSN